MLPFVKSLESQSKCFRQNAKNSKLMPLKSTHPLVSCPRLKYIIRFTILPHKKKKKKKKNNQGCVVRFGGWSVDLFIVHLKRTCSMQTQIESKCRAETLTLWETNPLLLENWAIVKNQVIFNCAKYYTTMRKHYEMCYASHGPTKPRRLSSASMRCLLLLMWRLMVFIPPA